MDSPLDQHFDNRGDGEGFDPSTAFFTDAWQNESFEAFNADESPSDRVLVAAFQAKQEHKRNQFRSDMERKRSANTNPGNDNTRLSNEMFTQLTPWLQLVVPGNAREVSPASPEP